MLKKKISKTKSGKSEGLKNFLNFFKNETNQKVIGFILILFSLYFFISFTSSFFQWKEDFSVVKNNSWFSILTDSKIVVNNALGKFGCLVSYLFVYVLFGVSAYFIPLFLLFSGIQLLGYHLLSIKKIIRQSIWGLICIPVFTFHFFNF